MVQGGYYFHLDLSSGRFIYNGEIGLGGSPGDQTVCVLGSPLDVHATATLLNANGAVPLGGGRWQITYSALLAAQSSGNKAVCVSTTA